MAAKTKEHSLILVTGWIGVILCFIGLISLLVSIKVDESIIEPQKYEFQVQAEPKDTVLDDFQIAYDFVNEKGTISFKVYNTSALEYLSFDFPTEDLKVTEIHWNNSPYGVDDNTAYYVNGTHYFAESSINPYRPFRILSIKNLNISTEYRTYINIDFEGKLYPNAEISLLPSMKVLPRTADDRGAFFKFYLGERYSCIREPCYSQIGRNDIDFKPLGNWLGIAPKQTAEGYRVLDYERFRLNYSKESGKWLRLLHEASFYLLSLGGLPALQLIILSIINRRTKRIDKK
jgi:hypothetical protein